MPHIEIFKWNWILDRIRAETEAKRPKRDPMRLAVQYQNLLGSKVTPTMDKLLSHLGAIGARVTQVLDRLNETDDESARRRFGDTG